MKKEKIIELLNNESIDDVSCIRIKDSLKSMENEIIIFYNDKKGLSGSITQTF